MYLSLNVTQTLSGHSNWISRIAADSSSRFITASYDGTMILWNVNQAEPLLQLVCSDQQHPNNKEINDCSFVAQNETYVLSASRDGTLKVWNTKTNAQIGAFVCTSGCTAVAAAPKLIALSDSIGRIYFLSLENLK
jgi:WD40 repeat protein